MVKGIPFSAAAQVLMYNELMCMHNHFGCHYRLYAPKEE
jgi:hypothetical protein